ncbi:GLE1-like protein-domain-containing protein [Cytidiella melzeri]|nr:GLE1-like protein-domain-containing protein [Cytidiella melzeri]
MLASIRLRVAHHDVYEEWEQQTRKDAFVSARHEHAALSEHRRYNVEISRTQMVNSQTALHQRQLQDVQSKLSQFRGIQQQQEQKMRAAWNERNGQLWKRIESVIKLEEDKVKARLEAEQRKREEEDRKRREEERRMREEQERKLLEEQQKKQEKEKKQRQQEHDKAKQEEDQRRLKEEEARKAAQDQAADGAMQTIGTSTVAEDWKKGRELLKKLKSGPMKTVKSDKQMKSIWSAGRRQITPKIGQLTNDTETIKRVSQQLIEIVKPPVPHPKPIYFALLSSLSKAILLQAETEVTAEKRSAIPLAQVTANLLCSVERFCDVFWAKLCQRAGGWPVPLVIPAEDTDNTPFDEPARRKVLGYRPHESAAEYSTRVSGLMRVYFHILTASVDTALDPRFRLPRYWTFFARILQQPQLLEAPVGPEVIFSALDVYGAPAREIWGAQWVKLLSVLYEGATTGLLGDPSRLIGGKSAEGIAARVRVQLEIERIMGVL